MKLPFSGRTGGATLLGLLVTVAAALIQIGKMPALEPLYQRLELLAYDLRLNATLRWQPPPGDHRIVIVDVDEASLASEGRWPWPRDKVATLTHQLFDNGAIVVGYDIMFAEPERNFATGVLERLRALRPTDARLHGAVAALTPEFDNDGLLARSLANRDTVLGFVLHSESAVPVGQLPTPLLTLPKEAGRNLLLKSTPNYTANLPALQAAAATAGFITTWPDVDGVIRRTPILIRYGDQVHGSLALNVARLYLLLDEIKLKTAPIGEYEAMEGVALGDALIPTDAEGRTLIPFRGPGHSFPYLSATDVLHGRVAPEQLQNAIVLVGASAIGIGDVVATPVQAIFPGVEIHANVIAGILDKRFATTPPWAEGANFATTVVFGLALATLLPQLGPLLLVLTTLLAAAGIIAFNVWLWQTHHLALDLAWPLALVGALALTNLAIGFINENRKRAHLRQMFEQYVPPELVNTMAEQPDSYGFEGESRDMTVLFADIRGFTTLSETLPPAELRRLLNRYFTAMTAVIFSHHGTIDKYVGDMIMAFWGAPVADTDHARHALTAALEMQAVTARLRPQLVAEGFPEIHIGIGLNSGMMNVGDMGSEFRRAYTVLGDNVNLASRIEGLTKYYGAGVVVGESTRARADDYLFRRLDLVRVKGKTRPVTVYEPLCPRHMATAELLAELEQHEAALQHYLERRWQAAETLFIALRARRPDVHVYSLYLDRIAQLRTRTLGDDWDGVYERREK